MNILKGEISKIEANKNLSLVTILIDNQIELISIVVDTPNSASYLKAGNTINSIFNETEVTICKTDAYSTSIPNKINGTIDEIENGVLLTKIKVNSMVGNITSVITTHAFNQLGLKKGDKATTLINANNIMLSE